MYKVLIVDDDGLIREDVQTLIDWQAHGFDVIGEADNGKAALQLTELYDPDIILTDIYMPVMDGMELIKRVKNAKRHAKILVMSNYDDFKSVKEAMKYGASDYVLKYKLDPDVLLELLGQFKRDLVVERLESEHHAQLEELRQYGQQTLVGQFWLSWLTGTMEADSFYEQARRLNIPAAKGVWLPILIQADKFDREMLLRASEQVQLQDVRMDAVKVTDHQYFLLIYTTQKSYLLIKQCQHEIALQLAAGLMEQRGIVVKGDICAQPPDLQKQFKLMNEKLSDLFYDGFKALLDTSTAGSAKTTLTDSTMIDQYELSIIQAIQAADGDYARDQLALLHRYLAHARLEPSIVRSILQRLGDQLFRVIKTKCLSALEQIEINAFKQAILSERSTLDNLTAQLTMMITQYVEQMQSGSLNDMRVEIRYAMNFMERNYASEISLADVSNYVGLSKNYFCKLFKQETGDNFINVLNKIRIEKAKLLIMQPDSRVKEIAGKVGLDNYRYFCRIFKQLTGLKPTEFKQSANPVR
ncbi:response regulator [Paenibacillus pinistramenti]|uniref:response regulator n=1 Tax=Paenibacillus pinistramenti TaxID=1768003 RepID=UPI001109ACD4|nr:response regulator [Paenibacillus pinistramenti]